MRLEHTGCLVKGISATRNVRTLGDDTSRRIGRPVHLPFAIRLRMSITDAREVAAPTKCDRPNPNRLARDARRGVTLSSFIDSRHVKRLQFDRDRAGGNARAAASCGPRIAELACERAAALPYLGTSRGSLLWNLADVQMLDEHQIDWKDTTRRLRAAIRMRLGPCDEQMLLDLVQEASVGLLRQVRREGARNLHGLISVIAHRTAIDEIRRRTRRRLRSENFDELSKDIPEESSGSSGDRLSRLWFLAMEFFRQNKSDCQDLGLKYAQLHGWELVARELGITTLAVRGRWSRCMKAFRDWLSRDPELMEEWLPAHE